MITPQQVDELLHLHQQFEQQLTSYIRVKMEFDRIGKLLLDARDDMHKAIQRLGHS